MLRLFLGNLAELLVRHIVEDLASMHPALAVSQCAPWITAVHLVNLNGRAELVRVDGPQPTFLPAQRPSKKAHTASNGRNDRLEHVLRMSSVGTGLSDLIDANRGAHFGQAHSCQETLNSLRA